MADAHIGSPEVVMQGVAGPYAMMVSVTPPDVIPGVAKVTVYLQEPGINQIFGRAIYYRTGDEGAPEPDPLLPVAGMPGQYAADIWMMAGGSSSIQIQVEGQKGKGEMVVPVVAASTATRTMPKETTWTLIGLGGFLVILMITIVGKAVSDALTRRQETISSRRRLFRSIGFVAGALFCALIVYGGNAWWQSWAKDYDRFRYKPMQASSEVVIENGISTLKIAIDTNDHRRASGLQYVVPDHGKMMHLFVLRIPAMDAFAHLHPRRTDSVNYYSVLPPLPSGKYVAFADIVYLSGYTETIKDTFQIEQDISDSISKTDPDDAYAYAFPADVIDNVQLADPANTIICGTGGKGVKLKDGSTMIWEGSTNEPLRAGQIYPLQFLVTDADGNPAVLDSYLGMKGHAAVIRTDANVYMHLHPAGTVNQYATSSLVNRIRDTIPIANYPDAKSFADSIDARMKQWYALPDSTREAQLQAQMIAAGDHDMSDSSHAHMVSFPYSFPTAGQYRVWVQVKHRGQILTAAFDRVVE